MTLVPSQIALGMGGHHSAKYGKDEWLTPPELLAALGPFDLDPCAPVARPWPTAAHHFTIVQNGLKLAWFGRVWLNPPYGRKDVIGPWLRRMVEHGRGTALIFARTETDLFFETIWRAAQAVLFLRGRLNFHHVDGRRARKNAGAPSVLVAYGRDDADRLAAAGLEGQLVALNLPTQIAVLDGRDLTWRALLAEVIGRAGEKALVDVYVLVAGHPKARRNPHWRDKVRQILQQAPFRRVSRGVYAV